MQASRFATKKKTVFATKKRDIDIQVTTSGVSWCVSGCVFLSVAAVSMRINVAKCADNAMAHGLLRFNVGTSHCGVGPSLLS